MQHINNPFLNAAAQNNNIVTTIVFPNPFANSMYLFIYLFIYSFVNQIGWSQLKWAIR